uniref:Uncharacterized protein n=1 Tax=Triticum urartu TaxID=4572 RepID=A0A8R7U3C9_TRIUA
SMSWPLFDVCLPMFFLQVLFNPPVASGCRVVIKVPAINEDKEYQVANEQK